MLKMEATDNFAYLEEEEKILEKENEREEERLMTEYEERLENNSREQCYNRLMNLLAKSKVYTQILKKKLVKEEEKAARKLERAQKSEEAKIQGAPIAVDEKNISKSSGVTNQSDSALKDKNDNLKDTEGNMNPNKKRKVVAASEKHNIGDIIDRKTIDAFEKQHSENKVPSEIVPVENKKPRRKQAQPKLFEGGTLRAYQLDGLRWLRLLLENGSNGILADEMGLGKTLQIIGMICFMIERGLSGPFLILAPLSTLPNWISEFERFAPKVPVVLLHGNVDAREEAKRKVRSLPRDSGKKHYPVVLTTFEVPLKEHNFLRKFSWHYMVIDEGHRLKNHKCQLATVLRSVKALNRIILTGTPLQNDLKELWSLLNFVIPDLFDDIDLFESLFDITKLVEEANNEQIVEEEKEKHVISSIHEILSPFMLRRVKSDVDLEIPPKKELLVYTPMTETQMKLYQATLDHNITFLKHVDTENENPIPSTSDGKRQKRKCTRNVSYDMNDSFNPDQKFLQQYYGEKDEDNQGTQCDSEVNDLIVEDEEYYVNVKMQNPMMMLRKIVNHPYLVHFPLNPYNKELLIDEKMITRSGKLLVVDAMLSKLKARGHKVLLFSTFTGVLDILEDYALMREYKYCRLDGSCSLENRGASIKDFNSDPDIFLFLLSTRAAGLGINLTSADTVIIYDSDWNPQVDLQAQDRCHRIGQTKPVVVYRLVTRGTIDEKIVGRAGAKRKLEKMIILKGKFSKARSFRNKPTSINPDELRALLNSKDHQGVIHAKDYAFSDEELERLLDRSKMMKAQRELDE